MVKKLNIGCGNNLIEDDTWINIDNSFLAKIRRSIFWRIFNLVINLKFLRNRVPNFFFNYPKVDIVDIRKKFPYANNSIDYIYCSQVIEHLQKYDLNKFIEECLRILKPGGLIRILTPDLEKIIKLYSLSDLNTFKENDFLESNNPCDHLNAMFYPRSHIFLNKRSVFTKFFDFLPEQHKYIYDFKTIFEMFKSVGYENIKSVDTKDSIFPGAKILDKAQDVSILLEAKKRILD